MADRVFDDLDRFGEACEQKAGLYESGVLLASKYRVLSRLGSGGNGTVYHVKQVFLDRDFALKTLDRKHLNETSVRRFQTEARAAARLRHANLVSVHDFGTLDGDQPFLVMDLVSGPTLAGRLEKNGALSVDEALPLFVQICLGLAYAHAEGIVHRDIKPSNIMLVDGVQSGTEGSAKIVDFGIAKFAATEGGEIQALTRTGEIFGSPLYMSPEQCSGEAVDKRSDIYSLGCVLFEALTGTPPHIGQNALATLMMHQSEQVPTLREASLGKSFPEALEQIVAKMLSKSPADRYGDLIETAHDLSNLSNLSNLDPAKAALPRRRSSHEGAVISMKASSFYSLLALVGLLSALLSGSLGYLLRQAHGQARPERKQAPVALSAEPVRVPLPDSGEVFEKKRAIESGPIEAILKGAVIKSKLVIKDKVAYKLFSFPSPKIGSVVFYNGFDTQQGYERAQGEVRFPADKRLALIIDGGTATQMIESPKVFEKIAPREFSGLTLDGQEAAQKNSAKLRSQISAANVASALRVVKRWTNLETLVLLELQLNEEGLSQINGMKRLRLLKLQRCQVDLAKLAALSIVKDLQKLDIDGRSGCNGDQLVSRLSESHCLESLYLKDVPVAAASLRKLRSCSKLSSLTLRETSFDDETMAALKELRSLNALALGGAVLSAGQIERLIGYSWLSKIWLSGSGLDRQECDDFIARSKGRIRFSTGS